ncbi:substrate-binding periplasmic protein [Dongshaea marina]|uniref:substrate-binding periplasmic protein n=1 Tax=Dongshaea marina TaxID=2047966 RepID=UPI000D3E4052|nr:transporter substrate-binding domain-containing protein [Dongshaea marina]
MQSKLAPLAALLLSLSFLSSVALANTQLSGVTLNWEPYYGKKLENNGFITEIAVAAFKAVGIDYSVRYMPWKRALRLVTAGEEKILHGAFYSEEREQSMYFSDPLYFSELVFVQNSDLSEIPIEPDALDKLKGYSIGVLNGGVFGERFEIHRNKLDVKLYNNYRQAVTMLSLGRYDMILESKDNIMYYIKLQKIPSDSVIFLMPPIESEGIYLAFSKKYEDNKKQVDLFNKGLSIIKENGQYEHILVKHGFKLLK